MKSQFASIFYQRCQVLDDFVGSVAESLAVPVLQIFYFRKIFSLESLREDRGWTSLRDLSLVESLNRRKIIVSIIHRVLHVASKFFLFDIIHKLD